MTHNKPVNLPPLRVTVVATLFGGSYRQAVSQTASFDATAR
jgi:hypothetical protein